MKITAFIAAVVAVATLATSASADVLDTIVEKYGKIDNFSAEFIQTTKLKVGNLEKRAVGKVYLKRPHTFFWDYQTDSHQKIFDRDGALYLYYPKANEAIRTALPKENEEFLWGIEKVKTNYAYVLKESNDGVLVELTPNKTLYRITKILLFFDKPSLDLKRVTLIDLSGGQTSFSFSGIDFGAIRASIFEFKIPATANILAK